MRRPPQPEVAVTAQIPPEAPWDEAFLRVESYLRVHQIHSRIVLNQLTNEIVAAARLADNLEGLPPVTLAIRLAQARMGDWLVQAVGDGDWADARFRARGRLALLLARIPKERPNDILKSAPLPPDVQQRLREAQLQSGPEVRLSGMPPAPLEFPLADTLGAKWQTFNRSAFVRSVGMWLGFAGLAGLAWFTTR